MNHQKKKQKSSRSASPSRISNLREVISKDSLLEGLQTYLEESSEIKIKYKKLKKENRNLKESSEELQKIYQDAKDKIKTLQNEKENIEKELTKANCDFEKYKSDYNSKVDPKVHNKLIEEKKNLELKCSQLSNQLKSVQSNIQEKTNLENENKELKLQLIKTIQEVEDFRVFENKKSHLTTNIIDVIVKNSKDIQELSEFKFSDDFLKISDTYLQPYVNNLNNQQNVGIQQISPEPIRNIQVTNHATKDAVFNLHSLPQTIPHLHTSITSNTSNTSTNNDLNETFSNLAQITSTNITDSPFKKKSASADILQLKSPTKSQTQLAVLRSSQENQEHNIQKYMNSSKHITNSSNQSSSNQHGYTYTINNQP